METNINLHLNQEPTANEPVELDNAYVYYMIFQLPNPKLYFNENQKPMLSTEDFLSKCLISAAKTNETNMLEQNENNSRFYFSDKAKAQSYRIPHTFNQLPETFFDEPSIPIGVIGLQVYLNEKPEIKGFHQRVVALNNIFNRNRVTNIYVSENYPNLDFIGIDKSIPIESPNNGFRQVDVKKQN